MTYEEARKILEGDFTEVVLSEGESHADVFAKAYAMAIEALEKIKSITEILDDTDFHNAESLNADGEDKGYRESICAISLAVDGKDRWI